MMGKLNFYSFALGVVFLIFGIWQIINPYDWFHYLPLWLKLDPKLVIYLNGTFDIIVGLALIFNFYSLIFSLLAALHLAGVIFSIGLYNDIAIRDLGLLILALAIFWDHWKKRK